MAQELHISISAEPLFTVAGLTVTNSMLTSVVVSTLLILTAALIRTRLKPTNKPTGVQNIAEFIIEALYNLVHSVTGHHHKTRVFFPFIATFMLWIMFNNYFGLLPGVGTIGMLEATEPEIIVEHLTPEVMATVSPSHEDTTEQPDDHTPTTNHEAAAVEPLDEVNSDKPSEPVDHESEEHHGPVFVPFFRAGTADLNTTLALGIISVILIQVFGVKFLGLKYFTKFFNFSSPIMFVVGLLELVSEFAKIMSFAFRLFGNIFAGEVLLVVIAGISPLLLKPITPMPFYGLELFVGFIQALVFSMLSLVFFNMATQGHDDH